MKLLRKLLGGLLLLLVVAVAVLAALLGHDSACPAPETAAAERAAGDDTMRGYVRHCYGSAEVLELATLDKPVPGPGEVLVKVHVAAVNPLDWHEMHGSPYIMRLSTGIGRPKQARLGTDFAGTVEAVGAGVSRFAPGDAVFGGGSGAFAEYLVIGADKAIAHKPAALDFGQAAALPIAGISALQAVRDKGGVEAGDRVLVNGASGGVGTVAVQLAKDLGAEVTGVSSARNHERVFALGADHMIDYKRSDYTRGERRYDVIIDAVGNHGVRANRRALVPGGTLVMVGASPGDWIGPLLNPIKAAFIGPFVDERFALLMAVLRRADLEFLAARAAEGSLSPVVDRRYSLEELPEAIRYSETGRARGKILIEMQKEAAGGDLEAKIRGAAEREIAESRTPALQIALGRGGELIYEGAFGLADLENSVPATKNTRMRAASVVKWMTATAAFRLAEAGRLDLDRPIADYCPAFPRKPWDITARQLLGHTAGIRHYIDFEAALADAGSEGERAELEQKRLHARLGQFTRYTDVIAPLAAFADDPLVFEPGTDWAYTSFGYRLLGCVVQGAAGVDYAQWMRESVLEPAGMTSTVPDDAWAVVPHRAMGYRLERAGKDGKSRKVRRADLRDVSENLPAGGYLSTASDLVRFALVFNGGLVSEANRALMASPAMGSLDRSGPRGWRDAIPARDRYGYGLMLFSKYIDGMVGHTGRQAGGSAIVLLLPSEDLALAVMTNAKGWNGYLDFAMELLDIAGVQADTRVAVE